VNTEDLNVDQNVLSNLPDNSHEPIFIASEIFQETLLHVGIDPDSAQTARMAFYALDRSKNKPKTEQEL